MSNNTYFASCGYYTYLAVESFYPWRESQFPDGVTLVGSAVIVEEVPDDLANVFQRLGSGPVMPHYSPRRWHTVRSKMGSLVCWSPSYCLIASVALQDLTPELPSSRH